MISIIIPVFNAESYLDKCLQSVLAQDFTDYEIVLIDDGSTDTSGEICNRYAGQHNNIRVIHQVNRGIGGAKNTGIENSKGEYLLFLDSDDTLPTNHLSVLLKTLEEADADLAVGSVNYCPGPTIAHARAILDTDNYLELLMYRDGVRDVSVSKLYKKSLFDNLHFREKLPGEDFEIFYELFSRAKKIAITDETTYYYYQRAASVSNGAFKESRFGRIDTCDRLKKNIEIDRKHLIPAMKACLLDEAINLLNVTPQQYQKERNWAQQIFNDYKDDVLNDKKATTQLKRKIRLYSLGPGVWKMRMYAKKAFIIIKNGKSE